MELLAKGQRLSLSDVVVDGILQVGLSVEGLRLDFASFSIDAVGKLTDERYMTFFNQPNTPCGGIALTSVSGDPTGFAFQLNKLPRAIDRVVITASVDGHGFMSEVSSGYLRLMNGSNEFARYAFSGSDFALEKAVMLGELYRKDEHWRFMAVGQGFNGGLNSLVQHFGGAVAESAPLSFSASINDAAVNLEKRVEREAPQLVNLVKQAGVSLDKVGLGNHRAKVCLVLDISASMWGLYRKGLVQKFAERILALGCKFDDDGEIDVFLFGRDVHQPNAMNLSNCATYIQQAIDRHPLEGNTLYGRAMEAVRRFYFPDSSGKERATVLKSQVPIYVMFVTDGTTNDEALTEKQLRWASKEPIFWQFMGIGKSSKSKNSFLSFFESDFSFLEKLDELDGRLVDNANFFSVSSPDEHSDSQLYDLLMAEYPGWLKLAKQNGLLA